MRNRTRPDLMDALQLTDDQFRDLAKLAGRGVRDAGLDVWMEPWERPYCVGLCEPRSLDWAKARGTLWMASRQGDEGMGPEGYLIHVVSGWNESRFGLQMVHLATPEDELVWMLASLVRTRWHNIKVRSVSREVDVERFALRALSRHREATGRGPFEEAERETPEALAAANARREAMAGLASTALPAGRFLTLGGDFDEEVDGSDDAPVPAFVGRGGIIFEDD